MATAAETQEREAPHQEVPDIRIYSHSSFFYWWPVWLAGFIMAAVTWLDGRQVEVNLEGTAEWIHPSQTPGLLYTLVLLLVILFTNVSLAGLASVVALLTIALVAVVLAYFDLWQEIVVWLPELSIHMNLGFYMIFSAVLFLTWLFTVFVFDRLTYWRIRPGQIIRHHVIGGAARSYDTHGMVFEKAREDLFRHWVLGLGSGDIRIYTVGAKREEIYVPNVLFADSKVKEIHRLIAVRPDDFRPVE